MTNEQLNEIKVRAGAATNGPWRVERSNCGSLHPKFITTDSIILDGFRPWSDADAEFIAHSRQDVPALVAEVERLRHRIEILETMISRVHDEWKFICETEDRLRIGICGLSKDEFRCFDPMTGIDDAMYRIEQKLSAKEAIDGK